MMFICEDKNDQALFSSPLLDAAGGVGHGLVGRAYGADFRLDPDGGLPAAYTRLADRFGTKAERIRYAKQVHGTRILHHTKDSPQRFEEADGHITDVPGMLLLTFHADCAPVFLYDPVHHAAGMLHAGWRGTAQDFPARGVRAMADVFGSRPQDIRAAIGPAICASCFETDGDVPEAMRAAYGLFACAHMVRRGAKFHVDMPALLSLSLVRAGVPRAQIETAGLCTCCGREQFWSHRGHGAARGVMAAALCLN